MIVSSQLGSCKMWRRLLMSSNGNDRDSSAQCPPRTECPLPFGAQIELGDGLGDAPHGGYAPSADLGEWLPMQCDRWRFTESGAIRDGEAPKLEELMISRDLRNTRCRRICSLARGRSLGQTLQEQVSRWA